MSEGERRKIIFLALFIFILDQSTKFFILKFLAERGSFEIIKNIFYLTLVKNTGAAFGIFRDSKFFLIIVSLIAIIIILINLKKLYLNYRIKISLSLILAGALGNLVDRLRFGYIVDFLDFRIWPVFNIADSSITIGAILLGYSILKSPPKAGSPSPPSADSAKKIKN